MDVLTAYRHVHRSVGLLICSCVCVGGGDVQYTDDEVYL